MATRRPVDPAPDPPKAYCQQFDPLFSQRNQRESFCFNLEGMLLPQERNKTVRSDRPGRTSLPLLMFRLRSSGRV